MSKSFQNLFDVVEGGKRLTFPAVIFSLLSFFSYSKSDLLANLASYILKPYSEDIHFTTSTHTVLVQATIIFCIYILVTFHQFSLALPFAYWSWSPHFHPAK